MLRLSTSGRGPGEAGRPDVALFGGVRAVDQRAPLVRGTLQALMIVGGSAWPAIALENNEMIAESRKTSH